MSNLSLNTGLKALLSSRFVLDTVGHNLANANTPGYSRQRVHLDAATALPLRGNLIGSGVDVARIERSVDNLLSRRIAGQTSVFGGLNARLSGLSELESFFGAGTESTLNGLLDGFFTSVSDLSTAPADPILRTGLVQASRTLSTRFHQVAGQLDFVRREAGSELQSRVNEINGLGRELAQLNVEVAKAQSTGVAANDLLDRRDILLQDLANLADITTVDGPNGTVGVLVAGSTLVGQTRANQMSLVLEGEEYRIQIAGSDGYVPVTGGAIGGLLELSSNDYPAMQERFDLLARELIRSVNRVHSTGVPPSGAFSILTGSNRLSDFDGDGNALDELLSNAGLPFEVQEGSLFLNVEDFETGERCGRTENSFSVRPRKGFPGPAPP